MLCRSTNKHLKETDVSELLEKLLKMFFRGLIKVGGWRGRGMKHAWDKWEMHTKFWLGNLKGRDHLS